MGKTYWINLCQNVEQSSETASLLLKGNFSSLNSRMLIISKILMTSCNNRFEMDVKGSWSKHSIKKLNIF